MEIDKINWSILECLQQNARASFADIGREVGLSAPAVAERMVKMEETGIVRGYSVDIDHEKAGYFLKAIITFVAQSGKLPPFLKMLDKMEEVLECHRVTGKYCLFMKVLARDAHHLEQILTRFSEYGDSITSIVLSTPVCHPGISRSAATTKTSPAAKARPA